MKTIKNIKIIILNKILFLLGIFQKKFYFNKNLIFKKLKNV